MSVMKAGVKVIRKLDVNQTSKDWWEGRKATKGYKDNTIFVVDSTDRLYNLVILIDPKGAYLEAHIDNWVLAAPLTTLEDWL